MRPRSKTSSVTSKVATMKARMVRKMLTVSQHSVIFLKLCYKAEICRY